jgi:cell division protein FtsI/penicillin-binding protein 2
MKRKQLTFRVRILSAAFICVGLILIARMYQLQVMQTEKFQARGESQYVHTKTDLYTRGSIYFTTRDGAELSAAAIQSGYVLAVNPSRVTFPHDEFCNTLNAAFALDVEKCIERTGLSNRTYVELAQQIPSELADPIKELDLDGAYLYKDQWRYYPGGPIAARSIGFIGLTGDEGAQLHGKYGLERYYDDILYQERQVMSVNFFAELFSNLGDLVYEKKGSPDW